MGRAKSEDRFPVARQESGVLSIDVGDEVIPLILRYRDVRAAAKDWQTFSSDAPFRVPIPSEENVRTVRQIPIETDPPLHRAYRKLLEPHFRKPMQADYLIDLQRLIDQVLSEAIAREEFDVVRAFALPLQSKALTLLLGLPLSHADTWMQWGTSLYNEGDGVAKGQDLDAYIQTQLERARNEVEGEDFFSALTQMRLDNRPLTEAEMVGIANLTFAGGRDTIINAVSVIIDYFARLPSVFRTIAADDRAVSLAVEEFVRTLSPLTYIGRVCPRETNIGAAQVAAGDRVGLCWASANFDETVFENPETFIVDRSPNPHIGFGSGHHSCLGALHARAVLRGLIKALAARLQSIEIVSQTPNYEEIADFKRMVAYEHLQARFVAA